VKETTKQHIRQNAWEARYQIKIIYCS